MQPELERVSQIEKEGRQIRFDLFKNYEVQEGHPGSILSIFDIANASLSETIKINKHSNINDVFIMSKGHAKRRCSILICYGKVSSITKTGTVGATASPICAYLAIIVSPELT